MYVYIYIYIYILCLYIDNVAVLLFRYSSEPTTSSVYFNPINSVSGSGTGTGNDLAGSGPGQDAEEPTSSLLHNFDEQKEQDLISILATTTSPRPRPTTTTPLITTTLPDEELRFSTIHPSETDLVEVQASSPTIIPEAVTATTTTTTTTTTTEVPATVRITAKEQARMCLFHGICDVNQIQKYAKTAKPTSPPPTTSRTTTTTTTTTTTAASKEALKTSGSNFALVAQIQRCIQTPEFCNTNLVSSSQKSGSTTSTTRTTTTTTRTTTTLDPLEIAR